MTCSNTYGDQNCLNCLKFTSQQGYTDLEQYRASLPNGGYIENKIVYTTAPTAVETATELTNSSFVARERK